MATVGKTNLLPTNTILLVSEGQTGKGGRLNLCWRGCGEIQHGGTKEQLNISKPKQVGGGASFTILPWSAKEEEGNPHHSGGCLEGKRSGQVGDALRFMENLDGNGLHTARGVVTFTPIFPKVGQAGVHFPELVKPRVWEAQLGERLANESNSIFR